MFHSKFGTGRCIAVVPRKKIDYRLAYNGRRYFVPYIKATVRYSSTTVHSTVQYIAPILYSTVPYCNPYPYRRISGDRKLSNRLTSASAPNTNKTYGGNPLLRYVLHAIHSRQCGSLHQRRKHGAPRCLRAQRSTVDHRGARPLAPHARPPWHSESVWKHKI